MLRAARSGGLSFARVPLVGRVAGAVALYAVAVLALIALGRTVDLPNESDGLAVQSGGLGAATHELLGHPHQTDFLIDYASAHALLHDGDAYGIAAENIAAVDNEWPVGTANPHPPTLLTLLLPIMVLRYDHALAAWSLGMAVAYGITLRLVGVPLRWAALGAAALTFTFPGAYGIGNPVPLIGLGIAIAWRWRASPVIAGLGIALAAAPKTSGLVLLVPFLLAGRWRTLAWAVGTVAVLAVVPLLWDPDVWSNYLDLGVEAARQNAARADNAAILHRLADEGIPEPVTLAAIALVTVALSLWRRDAFWPGAWFAVAGLPIAWQYSLLTLVPVLAFVALRGSQRVALFVGAAAIVTIGPSPAGMWPTWTFPTVVVLSLAALALDRRPADESPWVHPAIVARLPQPLRRFA